MKKRIITIATALMLAAAPAMAQVFIDDEDLNNRAGSTNALSLNNPGVFGLAGAYLLGKRRNEE